MFAQLNAFLFFAFNCFLMKFRILDKIAVADIAFEAFGKNENELFENAAFALFEIMANTKKLKGVKKILVKLSSDSLEGLMYDWLSELVFLKDTKSVVFGQFVVKVSKKKEKFFLNAKVSAEKIDYKKNRVLLRNDVKAITKHLFEIKKTKKGFSVLVIPDI